MFKKATRKQVKLRLALVGIAGSGKTYSALRLAKGLGGKIAVIDSESGSASLYANEFDFDVVELTAPYTVEKYITAIKAAEKSYDTIVIDSISHEWKGEGGILNKKEEFDSKGGNSFTNWGKVTPQHERFLAAMLHTSCHLITTVRAKTEYTINKDEKGKTSIEKMGLSPIQRDGLEFEMSIVFDLHNGLASASKDRTKLFRELPPFLITEDTGKDIRAWLDSGESPEPPKAVVKPLDKADEALIELQKKLFEEVAKSKWNSDQLRIEMTKRYNVKRTVDLKPKQIEELIFIINDTEPPLPNN